MKVFKEFQGVREGDVYPTTIKAGEECPPELEEAAKALGVFDGDSPEMVLTDAQKAEEAARQRAAADKKAAAEVKANGAAPENKSA